MARRVVLTSVGSFGDIHPFIAVGLALKARGCDVLFAAMENYRAKVEAEGLAFVPIRPTLDQVLDQSGLTPAQIAAATMRSGGMKFLLDQMILPWVEEAYADQLAALDGADLVVCSSMSLSAFAAAQKLAVPRITLLLSPMTLFSPHDPPAIVEIPWAKQAYSLGPLGARAVLGLVRAGSRAIGQPTAALRRRHGLPPPRGVEIIDEVLAGEDVIGLWSPALSPAPRNSRAHVVGFSFYDSEAGGPSRLDPQLEDFLSRGEPPLVFTLGSFAVQAPARFFHESVGAARALGRRAVLLVGFDAAKFAGLASSDVFVAGYAPHSLLFPRAAANIHHGGIGTTAQALRARRPQLVVPSLGDQPDNADRVVRAGVGARLDFARYTAERAERALAMLLSDAALAARAETLGAQVALEDGAAAAAELIGARVS